MLKFKEYIVIIWI